MSAERPSVAVIVPAYNAEATLPDCLRAIGMLTWVPDEVIVYSDGATDRTDAIARQAGARVIRNDGPPRGPAFGRNAAAKSARSEWLLFIDADVVVAPEALERMARAMLGENAIAAFGSYDDAPRSQRVTSLYANLRHHFVHQHGAKDASTFWSGLGLIERQAFLDAGGFDAVLFAHPSIEDIELGTRLVSAGHRIRLVPDAFGKHCKDWTLWRVWHTDVVRRAYPWSCLIADGRTAGVDLNVSTAERVKAVAALTGPLLLLAGMIWPAALLGAGAAVVLYIVLNRAFFTFLARRLPPLRAAAAMAMHWCYHIYSTFTYALVLVQTRLGLRKAIAPRPSPGGAAKVGEVMTHPRGFG